MRRFFCFIPILACTVFLQAQNPLQGILHSLPKGMDTLIQQADKFRIQIIYTQIDRDAQNHPHFQTFFFGDSTQYFNPASTVKMPGAFLALEKLHKLHILGLDKDSPMHTGAARPPQTEVKQDNSAENGQPSIAHYIKKIFLVSDNDAFNRLYEFIGQEPLNQQLREKGYTRSRIVHRLALPGFDTISNRYTNPVTLLGADGQMRYFQGEVFSVAPYAPMNLGAQTLGKGFISPQETLVSAPFDFSYRNYLGLHELHRMLQAVLFPEAVPASQRFNLPPQDYTFLYKMMSMLPRESAFPKYDPEAYYDSYVKFFLFGDSKQPIPDHIRIFNKVGTSYGFLTDVAYVVDFKNQVEFMLSATIYVNEDGILNDNIYEYDTIGMPFLAKLGQAVYDYELKRLVRRKPNLSKFKFSY